MDIALIAIVKRSEPYRAIRSRITSAAPSDSWYDEGLAFVVFDLQPARPLPAGSEVEGPLVVFVLAAASGALLAARVVERGDSGTEPTVTDLLVLEPA